MDAQTALEQLAAIYDRKLQPVEAAAEAMTIYLEMGERIAELDVIRASAKQVLADVLAEIGADRLEATAGVAYVTAPSIRSSYDAKGLDKLKVAMPSLALLLAPYRTEREIAGALTIRSGSKSKDA
jgi:predicted RNA-binding Zn ribbon-like protein